MTDIVRRLRSSEPLPACPYDKLSPHYNTAPNDKPCAVCGGLNDSDAPDLCRGADTRIMGEAADEIQNADRALVGLLCEFGWATGHGDTLIDLIGELAANMRKDRAAAEMTKRGYAGCLSDAHLLVAEIDHLRVVISDLVEINMRDETSDPDQAASDQWRAQAWMNATAALNIQPRETP